MMDLLRKYMDIPFVLIFLLVIVCATIWTAVSFFSVSTPFIMVPVWILTVYTILLVLYWFRLFIVSRQFREELEVWEVIQKKSVSLALSMELNLLFSVYYLYVAVRYRSQWFAFVGFFYIALTIARFILLREFCFEVTSLKSQYKRYIAAGYFMFFMMICLFLMTLMVVSENYVVEYPGHSIYIAAVFSLYLIVSAVKGYNKYKKYRSPLLSGNQMISISAALLGILSLQTAFLPMYSHYPDDIHKTNMFTGIVIFVIMITMSLYMIFHGSKVLVHGLDEEGNRIEDL